MNITPFKFDNLDVRVIAGQNNEPWFVAADVAAALTIGRTDDAVARLDADEKDAATIRTPGGDQEMTIISESGLYSLILTSRKAEAKRFKKWVTSEVLPSIRKTGSYAIQTTTAPLHLSSAVEAKLSEQLGIARLFEVPVHLAQVEAVKNVNQALGVDLQPWLKLAPAQDNIAISDRFLEPTEIGRMFGVKAHYINAGLVNTGLQIKTPGGFEKTASAGNNASPHQWKSGSKSGYNLKWRVSFVKDALGLQAAA